MKDGNCAGIFLEQALKNASVPEPTPARRKEPLAICRMSPLSIRNLGRGFSADLSTSMVTAPAFIESPQRAKSHLRPPTSVFSLSGSLQRLDCVWYDVPSSRPVPSLTLLSFPHYQLQEEKSEDLVDNAPQKRRRPCPREALWRSRVMRGAGHGPTRYRSRCHSFHPKRCRVCE